MIGRSLAISCCKHLCLRPVLLALDKQAVWCSSFPHRFYAPPVSLKLVLHSTPRVGAAAPDPAWIHTLQPSQVTLKVKAAPDPADPHLIMFSPLATRIRRSPEWYAVSPMNATCKESPAFLLGRALPI